MLKSILSKSGAEIFSNIVRLSGQSIGKVFLLNRSFRRDTDSLTLKAESLPEKLLSVRLCLELRLLFQAELLNLKN